MALAAMVKQLSHTNLTTIATSEQIFITDFIEVDSPCCLQGYLAHTKHPSP